MTFTIRMLTTAEAAAEKGVARQTIRKALASGRLIGQRFGTDWMVDPASLAAYKPVRKPPRNPERRAAYDAEREAATT